MVTTVYCVDFGGHKTEKETKETEILGEEKAKRSHIEIMVSMPIYPTDSDVWPMWPVAFLL